MAIEQTSILTHPPTRYYRRQSLSPMPTSSCRGTNTTYNTSYNTYRNPSTARQPYTSPYQSSSRYRSPVSTPDSYTPSSYSSSRYEPSKYVTSRRPLPAGPGPLDARGRKGSVAEHVKLFSKGASTPPRYPTTRRTSPVKADYLTSTYGTSKSSNTSGSEGYLSKFNRVKRTNSISDLTSGVSKVQVSSTTTPLNKASKRYGSNLDLSSTSRLSTPEKKHDRDYLQDSSFNSTGSHRSTPRKSIPGYDTNDTTVLPEIKSHRGRTVRSPSSDRSRDIQAYSRDDDSPRSHRRKAEESLRQDSNSSLSTICNGRNSVETSYTYSRKGVVGLRNLGNTCFMNSILQCLSNTQPLLEYCLNDYYKEEINKSTSSMKGSFISSYAKLMKSMWNRGADSYVSPSDFKSQISKYAPRFIGYNQQDAHEYLRYLLEGLHEDLNRVTEKKKRIILKDDHHMSAGEKAMLTWKSYLEYDNSKIVDLFVGQLKSSLTCTACKNTSNTFDPFWDLSLPIKKKYSDVQLDECFDLFTQEEILDGDERPTCEKCKERRKCVKSFKIQKFPKILVIHLKRFNQGSYHKTKLSTLVRYPVSGLDLSAYAAEKSACSVLYSLYAVANHSGTTYGGHYTADAKQPYSGAWHNFNDTRTSSTSPSRVQSPESYVLFYELEGSAAKL